MSTPKDTNFTFLNKKLTNEEIYKKLKHKKNYYNNNKLI